MQNRHYSNPLRKVLLTTLPQKCQKLPLVFPKVLGILKCLTIVMFPRSDQEFESSELLLKPNHMIPQTYVGQGGGGGTYINNPVQSRFLLSQPLTHFYLFRDPLVNRVYKLYIMSLKNGENRLESCTVIS